MCEEGAGPLGDCSGGGGGRTPAEGGGAENPISKYHRLPVPCFLYVTASALFLNCWRFWDPSFGLLPSDRRLPAQKGVCGHRCALLLSWPFGREKGAMMQVEGFLPLDQVS